MQKSQKQNKVALLGGEMVKFSLSPIIHNTWMKKYNIDGQYDLYPVSTACNLADALFDSLNAGYKYFNVTTPYKESIIPIINNIDTNAALIGAVNTVYCKNNSLFGSNTDYLGFIGSLERRNIAGNFAGKSALILGAGGAAKAMIFSLNQQNISTIYVYNRSESRADLLIKLFPQLNIIKLSEICECLPKCDILINTINDADAEVIHLVVAQMHNTKAIVCDLNYIPVINTEIIWSAQKYGLQTIDGLEILIQQAAASFFLWFGITPNFEMAQEAALAFRKK